LTFGRRRGFLAGGGVVETGAREEEEDSPSAKARVSSRTELEGGSGFGGAL
jgi:hypothetical protein